jgi:hypothetical protein
MLDQEWLAEAISDEKKRKMRGEDDSEKWGTKRQRGLDGINPDVTEEEIGRF